MLNWLKYRNVYPGDMPPEPDFNVLAEVEGVGWRVCYYYDNRWTYAVSEKWGFNVINWTELPEE